MKLIKALLVVTLVLVVLVAGAAIIIPMVVDPNAYKPEIQAQVKKATGRDLVIEGDLKLSVFPWLGVEIGPTRLSNAPGFGDDPFASVQAVDVKVKLLPLLQRRVEADTLVLDGLRVSLERNADGLGNWEDLAGVPPASGAASQQTDVAGTSSPGVALAGLAIDGVDIRDSELRWSDASAGTRVALREINLETGAVVPGEPLDVKGGFLLSSEAPKVDGRFTLDGRLDADPDAQRGRLENGVIEFAAASPELGIEDLQVRLALSLDADLGAQSLATENLELSVSASVADGQIAAMGDVSGSLNANLQAGSYDMRGVRLTFSAEGEGIPSGKIDGQGGLDATADLNAQTLAVSNLVLQVLDLSLTGSVNAERLLEQPAYSGQIDLAQFNPRALMERLGVPAPATRDPTVLTSLQISSDVRGNTGALSLESMRLVLDDTNVQGMYSVRDFSAPAFRFDYAIDSIDLDRYMPPEAPEPAPAADTAAGADTTTATTEAPATPPGQPQGAFGLPLETLRSLDVDGRATVGTLKVQNMRMTDVVVQLRAKDGVLELDPMSMRLYQGTGSLKASVDVRTETPAFQAQNEFKSIQVEPLVRDLTAQDVIEGTGNVRGQFTTAGVDADAMTRNLGGNFAINLRDGAVKGVNVAQTIREARAAYKGEKLQDAGPRETDFSEMSASGTITKGIVENRDLSMKTPLLRISGEGSADLPRQSIDYVVTATVVNTTKGQGGSDLQDLEQLPIPIKVTGSFDQPKYTPDVEAVLRAVAQKEGEERIQKELNKQLGDKLGEDVGNVLKGLLK